MFLILLKYEFGLKITDKEVEAHRAFLDKHYSLNKFICSGAKYPDTGGVILCNAESIEEVRQIITKDSFYKNPAIEYDIIEFMPSKYAAAFEPFIKKQN